MKAIGIICLAVFGTLVICGVLIGTLENAGYVKVQYSSSGDLEADRSVEPCK